MYVAAQVGSRVKIFAAQYVDEATQTGDWDVWHKVYDGATQGGQAYANELNGRLTSDGTTLWLVAHRTGTTSSPLHLLKFTLDADGP